MSYIRNRWPFTTRFKDRKTAKSLAFHNTSSCKTRSFQNVEAKAAKVGSSTKGKVSTASTWNRTTNITKAIAKVRARASTGIRSGNEQSPRFTLRVEGLEFWKTPAGHQ